MTAVMMDCATAVLEHSRPLSNDALDFTLPRALEASAPPEARGLARDEVRLMVSYVDTDRVVYARFRDLPAFLDAGDVVVINTSATLPAALTARRATGEPLAVHLSTQLAGDEWVVEVRTPAGAGSTPYAQVAPGDVLSLPLGATISIRAPHHAVHGQRVRLWRAALRLPMRAERYLARAGSPIRYGYVAEPWPLASYQTVYATEPGSAEMPSAGRAFTPEVITRLVAKGVLVAPLVLHTGVASVEAHEPPFAERYRVPATTARAVNVARAAGGRVVAVGTTVVRALETAADGRGRVQASDAWTDLVITPERGLRVVQSLITGFHEPRASHLAMLEALAGRGHLRAVYAEALAARYLWHEFGDVHLILPAS